MPVTRSLCVNFDWLRQRVSSPNLEGLNTNKQEFLRRKAGRKRREITGNQRERSSGKGRLSGFEEVRVAHDVTEIVATLIVCTGPRGVGTCSSFAVVIGVTGVKLDD